MGHPHVFHVVLHAISCKVVRSMHSVEVFGGLNVGLLKVLLVDTKFVHHLCAQVNCEGVRV